MMGKYMRSSRLKGNEKNETEREREKKMAIKTHVDTILISHCVCVLW